ncbi:sugar porter family MFS transporter [Aestuariibacter sp. A3R04]|uniref:sugar porter family MFS transporter n=1 Tax=Aestuariibacter sp. A3R04 TaxID=2841571 RepID=UPI001C0A3CA8|nr:sugar porter family MFS transporter [Aestuariibacter sp. A3R04]MBU3021662.1 sugar porter family MFS transporter [Aestuariibacter sp. A3R04]
MHRCGSSNVLYVVIVALGGFIFGFDASVISGVVRFVATEFQLNEWQQGLVVSAPTLGAVLGSFFAGPCADKFGRKNVLISIAFIYCFSSLLSASATSYSALVFARCIGGIAFASLVLAPMYIAEISPSQQRGKMISINQLNIVVGFSAAYFANYFLLKISASGAEWADSLGMSEHVWRWMLGIEVVPAVLYLVALTTIPESPRWLVMNNRIDEGKRVIGMLFPSAEADKFVRDIKGSQTRTMSSLSERLTLLFSKPMRLVLAVGLLVACCQQITGVNAVYFYAPTIFEQSGIGQDAAYSQAILVGLTNVVFTIVAMLLIDKLGRKPLMLIGLAGVAVSMSVVAYGFSQATYSLSAEKMHLIENREVKEKVAPLLGEVYTNDVQFKNAIVARLGKTEAREYESALIQAAVTMNPMLILAGILGFVASFAVSLGPVMWVLLAEIFPNHIRGIGIAFTGLFNSIVSFSVQLVFPVEVATLGTSVTFLIYGVFAVFGFVLVYRVLPETKGKSLEDIENVLVITPAVESAKG